MLNGYREGHRYTQNPRILINAYTVAATPFGVVEGHVSVPNQVLGGFHDLIPLCNPKTHRHIPRDFQDPVFQRPSKESFFSSILKDLSEDAGVLVKAAIEAPGELKEAIRDTAPKGSQEALKKYMTQALGWPAKRLNHAWSEVSACL